MAEKFNFVPFTNKHKHFRAPTTRTVYVLSELFAEMLEGGIRGSMTRTAKKLGITHQGVSDVARKNGIKINGIGGLSRL